MATTPPAAKVNNDDEDTGLLRNMFQPNDLDVMEIDHPSASKAGDKETTPAHRRSNSQTSKDQARLSSTKQSPVEILDDEDEAEEDGDEQAYAVETVLAHKIGKKTNVRALSRFTQRLIMFRENAVSYTRSNGLALTIRRMTPGRMKRTAKDHSNWWTCIGRASREESLHSTRNQDPHGSVICPHLVQIAAHGNVVS
jgi:hypothetical protein